MKSISKFRGEKLQALFPSHLHYYFEKIYGACDENQPTDFGAIGVDGVFDYLEQVKAALKKRERLKSV